jgi:hypothetical protein
MDRLLTKRAQVKMLVLYAFVHFETYQDSEPLQDAIPWENASENM